MRRLRDVPGSALGRNERVVALTFDDGPTAGFTPGVLDALARHHATASFFMTAHAAEREPELVARVAAAGHGIGCHTWDHTSLVGLGEVEFAHQVDDSSRVIAELSGKPVRFLRPPYGEFDATVLERAGARGLNIALWSVDPRDWSGCSADEITAAVMGALHPGAIILLHDGGGRDRRSTVSAVPAILDAIAARGYRTVAL